MRFFLSAVAIVSALLVSSAQAQIRVVDAAGRTVMLQHAAKRVVMAQGRHLPAMALIERDPASLVVGWQNDMKRQDPSTYAQYARAFPALDAIPVVGEGSPETLSIEKVMALKPDVVLMSFYTAGMRGTGEPSAIVKRIEAAGIPVVILDFFGNPLRDTVVSLRALGDVIGRRQEADAYLDFYQSNLTRIRERLERAKPALPSVFIHVHAGGVECCYSSGQGTFDDFITIAGGTNIARDIVPGSTGQLSLEYLIAKNPQIYVATGGAHMEKVGGLVLGTGVDRAAARAKLAEIVARPGLSSLSAVANGNVHGFWQNFNDSPTHIVVLEMLAKRFHPGLFVDIDPATTLDEINGRFAAVPLTGTFWVDLK